MAVAGTAGAQIAAPTPVAVQVPSLDADRATRRPLQLPGTWFATAAPGPVPAMLLLHGCGGPNDSRAQPGSRYSELAAWLNALGVHVLVTDSFTPRGERELCTQRTGDRRITQVNRRRDALGALQWLAAQPGVDAARIGLLGWSHGGSTVLAATNLRHHEVLLAAVRPSLAVAYYPGCAAELRRGYRAAAPLLMLLGEADDWTPAEPCKSLAAQADPGPAGVPQWEAYAGAHHGFDGRASVRLRQDVPNGAQPGRGVHVGGNPEARAASRERLERFLRQNWGLAP